MRKRMRQLRGLLRRHGRTRDDADDLIQEAFLRLHLYSGKSDIRKQDAFLARTVLNLSVDMHRKEHRHLYADQSVETLMLADFRPTPDEDLAASQRLHRVEAVLAALSPRTRDIFLMHRVEGYGCSDIAQHFGISLSAVEKHIAKAVLALMDVVEPQ
jgi:RNA polymerase sigma factor (sigma-70 family)